MTDTASYDLTGEIEDRLRASHPALSRLFVRELARESARTAEARFASDIMRMLTDESRLLQALRVIAGQCSTDDGRVLHIGECTRLEGACFEADPEYPEEWCAVCTSIVLLSAVAAEAGL